VSASGLAIGFASALREAAAGRPLPPIAKWNPARCGTIAIRILRDGTWLHEDSPIRRLELVRLFSTLLRKEGDDFYLITPVEKLRIQVDDAPFQAVLVRAEDDNGVQKLVFTTNVGDDCVADGDHPVRVQVTPETGSPAPYIRVRDDLDALIARNVFYELAERSVPHPAGDPDVLGVWSAGIFFPLGSLK
jgi:hypothetical protein